jgi:NAD(P)H-dependent FMN reductase
MNSPPKVLVIGGSVRVQRLNHHIAEWVAGVGRGVVPARFEVVDLRDWPLPLDDEPDVPAMGKGYVSEHTRAWSAKIAAADGFVFVSPQYNLGYPAALKNALDHLFREWSGKPALIVTYGGRGGDRCAAQLAEVLAAFRMRTIITGPGFLLSNEHIRANAGEIDPAVEFAGQRGALEAAFGDFAAALAVAPDP